ncbi:MAG TPA: HEAT repeat domain-containing protein [Phycisphaerae bacterium]|nr:HEAT repeat domain-containing protein [Phycisphaerae bacterium]
MSDPEVIKKRIDARRKCKSWVAHRIERMADLDATTRTCAAMLLGYRADKGDYVGRARGGVLRSRGAWGLIRLDDAECIRLGERLFPQFADAFRAAWGLFDLLPYPFACRRLPFRAPGRPDLQRVRRLSFLSNLVLAFEGLDEDLPWIATHAPYLPPFFGADDIGVLLAGAISLRDSRAEAIKDVLYASADGRSEVGEMGYHVLYGLLCGDCPECWEYVEKLLIAAQRQEGLRQSILELIDISHPEAFRRMVRLIVDRNLVRFSSVVRAADVWLDLQLDSQSQRFVHDTLQSVLEFWDEPQACKRALAGKDARAVYLALWSIAVDSAPAMVPLATELLRRRQPEIRFAALQMLGMLDLAEAYAPIISAVDDRDERVAVRATQMAHHELHRRAAHQAVEEGKGIDDLEMQPLVHQYLYYCRPVPPRGSGDLFERLERLLGRLPAKSAKTRAKCSPAGASARATCRRSSRSCGARRATCGEACCG